MLLGFSKYYVDSLSENVKRGNKTKIEMGWRPNRAPVGYRNEYTTKTIVPDEQCFHVIQRLFALALTGEHSVLKLSKILRDDWGFRAPRRKRIGGKPLACSSVDGILRNPFYAGQIRWNGELHPGKQIPMISWEDFTRLQRLLEGRGRKSQPKRYSFAFTGLIRCGACGGMITAEHKTNRFGSKYVYYHCNWGKRRPRCTQPSVEVRALEADMRNLLANAVIHPFVYRRSVALVAKLREEDERSIGERKESLERALEGAQSKLRIVSNMRINELIDDNEFRDRRAELLAEQKRLLESRAQLENVQQRIEPLHDLNLACARLLVWFNTGSDALKRGICRLVGSNLYLLDKKLRVLYAFPVMPALALRQLPVWSAYLATVRTLLYNGDATTQSLVADARAVIRLAEEEGLLELEDLSPPAH